MCISKYRYFNLNLLLINFRSIRKCQTFREKETENLESHRDSRVT